ncbi:MAG TPA: hypothetical protein DEP01_07660 [Aminobacterium sp.]|jgi:hypothetical protein|nr:hypothetical protein [Aminobacterium sp.]
MYQEPLLALLHVAQPDATYFTRPAVRRKALLGELLPPRICIFYPLTPLIRVKAGKRKEVWLVSLYIPVESRLQLRINLGPDENGDMVLKSMNFSDVLPEAEADKVDLVAKSLASLLEYPLEETLKIDSNAVEEQ